MIYHHKFTETPLTGEYMPSGKSMPSNGLVFYAPLSSDQSTAETGQTLTKTGIPTFDVVNGIACAYFDGSSGYTLPAIDVSTYADGFTISAWLKPATSSDVAIISRRSGTYQAQYWVGFSTNNMKFWAASSSITANISVSTSIATFVHAAWVYANGVFDLYINGTRIGGGSGAPGTASGDTSIAVAYYSGENYKGNAAAVRIYNRALTSDEITTLATEYVKYKPSGKTMPSNGLVFYAPFSSQESAAETGQTFTISGGTLTYTDQEGIPSAYFDGSTVLTFLDTGLPSGTSARTLSMWVRLTSFVSSSNADVFGYGGSSSAAYCGIELRQSGSILFGGYNADLESNTGLITTGTWYHVAVTKDGSAEAIYLNGEQVASGTTSKNTSLGTGIISGVPWASGAVMFNGNIAAARIFDTALSAQDITTLSQEFVPKVDYSSDGFNKWGKSINYRSAQLAGCGISSILNDETVKFFLYPTMAGGSIADISASKVAIGMGGTVSVTDNWMQFGSGNYLYIDANTLPEDIMQSGGKWLVEMIINTDQMVNYNILFGNGNTDQSRRSDLLMNSSGGLWVGGKTNASGSIVTVSTNTLVALQYDPDASSQIRIYVNGALYTNTSNSFGALRSVVLGIGWDTSSRYFRGKMLLLRIRNVAPYAEDTYQNDFTKLLESL